MERGSVGHGWREWVREHLMQLPGWLTGGTLVSFWGHLQGDWSAAAPFVLVSILWSMDFFLGNAIAVRDRRWVLGKWYDSLKKLMAYGGALLVGLVFGVFGHLLPMPYGFNTLSPFAWTIAIIVMALEGGSVLENIATLSGSPRLQSVFSGLKRRSDRMVNQLAEIREDVDSNVVKIEEYRQEQLVNKAKIAEQKKQIEELQARDISQTIVQVVAEAQSRKLEILVVDDSADDLMLLSMAFSRVGHVVHTASNGEQALRSLDSQLPSLIVVDLALPRMNGIQLCRRLRAEPRTMHTPVIAVSGVGKIEDAMRDDLIVTGFRGFVAKPLDGDFDNFVKQILVYAGR